MKKYTKSHVEKAQTASQVLSDGKPIIDEYLELYDEERKKLAPKIRNDFFNFYKRIASAAVQRVRREKAENKVMLDADEDNTDEEDIIFVNDNTLRYMNDFVLCSSVYPVPNPDDLLCQECAIVLAQLLSGAG